jgi:hypothetical protein
MSFKELNKCKKQTKTKKNIQKKPDSKTRHTYL